ncbi:hypothetical protein [Microbacterium telephonicum]|uniref:Lipoprotein n=1 Tax=Microbacterium telephonicum TaxID=1714841 RepID=A0A498BWL0_9MICO|nr:hypothetical protein [Microbacterium telephonicum]RLK47845.1 hypothetical protein C7474_2444 [Microbacterium telephonicum]
MSSRLPLALTAAALGAVLLAGCTADPTAGSTSAPQSTTAPDTQTTADACAAVEDAVTGAVDAFQKVDPTDPQAAAQAFDDLASSLGTAADAVSDSEVGALLPRLQQDFATAAEVMGAVAGGDLGRVGDLQAPTADIQDAFGEFAALCR